MKVILLAGQNPFSLTYPVSLAAFDNQPLLDHHIELVVKLGFEPLVVLDGKDADLVLLNSKKLAQVELIYDTNDIPTFMTNLRSGLYATHRECFVLPIWQQIPSKKAWQQMIYSYYHRDLNQLAHVVQPYCPVNGEMTAGFPLLVTKNGRLFLRRNKDIQSLSDERVKLARVAVLQPAITTQVNFSDQDLPELRAAL